MLVKISAVIFAAIVSLLQAASSSAQEIQNGLRVPAGFKVQQVAGDELATNIYCLGVGKTGAVFVSGPGYIKRLIDVNQDGMFEAAKVFAAFPKTGAQGMWIEEKRLYCIGDGGFWEFCDADQDGVADGPPIKRFPMTTGQEHSAHAIRKGPDGWFYVLCGNATEILPQYMTSSLSPIKNPEAGFLLRISPDFRQTEIVAHGFRNAYDFDFDLHGRIYVYDSDGERDISLPWYRPTRVFQIQPGDHAGWISPGWKRPSYFLDMPIEAGSLGRGSPTGVELNRGDHFPLAYQSALLVADWTFGRVVAFKPIKSGGYATENLVVADGQFGFAVTDLAFTPEGKLLISVGGRGTSGAVYQLSYEGEQPRVGTNQNSFLPETIERYRNQRRKLDPSEMDALLDNLSSSDHATRKLALETLVGRAAHWPSDRSEFQTRFRQSVLDVLENFDPNEAKLVFRAIKDISLGELTESECNALPMASRLLLKLSRSQTRQQNIELVMAVARALVEDQQNAEAICRIGQLAMEGCGGDQVPEMFKGYSALSAVSLDAGQRKTVADALSSAIAKADSEGNQRLVDEIGRLAAMLRLQSADLQNEMLGQIRRRKSAVDQIHWLNCLACTVMPLSASETAEVAETLAKIDLEIVQQGLETDRNWVPRMRELVSTLFGLNEGLPLAIASRLVGRDGQVYLFDELPQAIKPMAVNVFVEAVESDVNSATPNQLRIVASSPLAKSQRILESAVKVPTLRDTALLAICLDPHRFDRSLVATALQSADLRLVKQAAIAIRRRNLRLTGTELLILFQATRRLAWTDPEVSVRDQIMLVLRQQHAGDALGYQFKLAGEIQYDALDRWEQHLKNEYPADYRRIIATDEELDWKRRLQDIDWSAGNGERGAQLYRDLKCAQCHDGASRMGPRLEGVTRRFSRADLFRTIYDPSHQVPDRYRAQIVETVDGELFKGIPIYESTDGVTLQTVDGETIRINRDDIEAKTRSDQSLMPSGLLDTLDGFGLASLYKYLQEL
jgi:putative heme-binding domain-containing protein